MSGASEDIITSIEHLTAGKYFEVSVLALLIYDYMITFDEEVERIWKKKISWPAWLFLMNRYLTPLQFVVDTVAFHLPIPPGPCIHVANFEGIMTVILVSISEMIMILRVFALYGRSRVVLGFLGVLLVAQVVISFLGLTKGFPARLPPGAIGCILVGDHPLFPSLWVTPLVTDSAIFILTVIKTRKYYMKHTHSLLHIFVRDGTLYYFVILLANLFNVITFYVAPVDLRALGASFSHIITSIMINRLVFNIREAGGSNRWSAHRPNHVSNLNFRNPNEDGVERRANNARFNGRSKHSDSFN